MKYVELCGDSFGYRRVRVSDADYKRIKGSFTQAERVYILLGSVSERTSRILHRLIDSCTKRTYDGLNGCFVSTFW